MNLLTIKANGQFTSGPVTLGADWTEVFRVRLASRHRRMVVRGGVTVAALTGLRVATSPVQGDDTLLTNVLTDADLADPVEQLMFVEGLNPHLTVAGAAFQLTFDVEAVGEFVLYAKSAASGVLTCHGRVSASPT